VAVRQTYAMLLVALIDMVGAAAAPAGNDALAGKIRLVAPNLVLKASGRGVSDIKSNAWSD